MTTLTLSPDQAAARDAVLAWYDKGGSSLLTMGGFAGTGKTTTLGAIAHALRRVPIAYVCFTGKASLVLKTKLKAAGVHPDYVGTIHSLIYEPVGKVGGVMKWKLIPTNKMKYRLIVIDEASMISEDLLRDLQSFGIPILAVGDHGQLPPVSGKLNLMLNPEIKLEHIHRQAENSPIIKVSMLARLEGHIPVGTYGPGVVKTRDRTVLDRIKDPKAGMILCGTNATRGRLNSTLRRPLTGPPVAGERVVCLKNDREQNVYNGMIGEISSIAEFDDGECPLCIGKCIHYNADIRFDDVEYLGPILRSQFGAAKTDTETDWSMSGGLFDWGFCITTHKSQGSEWDAVIVVEECDWMPEADRRRWMYTSATRARSKLVIIGK